MASVLHLTHRYWPVKGGSEEYLRQIATRQANAGHNVTVVTTNARDFSYFWDPKANCFPIGETIIEGVRIVRIPVRHLPGTRWSFGSVRRIQSSLSQLPALGRLAGTLARWTPYLPDLADRVRSLGTDWQFVFGWNVTFDGLMARAKRTAGECNGRFIAVPFLHLGEGQGSPIRRYYTMAHQIDLLRSAEHIIVQTPVEERFLVDHNISPERLAVVGAGIDPQMLRGGDGASFRRRHGIEGPIVTFIGPQTYDKGAGHLLEAARQLRMAGRQLTVVLVGQMMDDFHSYWSKVPFDLRDGTCYLGSISDEEKGDLLAAAEILALPSRIESFGIVLLEAWFYAKPVIAADAGALSAVVDDGVDGRLVPFGDVSALAGAIAEILDHPALARMLGENGRRKTLDHYTWQAVYDRFSNALTEKFSP